MRLLSLHLSNVAFSTTLASLATCHNQILCEPWVRPSVRLSCQAGVPGLVGSFPIPTHPLNKGQGTNMLWSVTRRALLVCCLLASVHKLTDAHKSLHPQFKPSH